MRWLLLDIASAFNNVYSGWILWNLFLAFIPLVLSFSLFRRQALPKGWFLASWLVVGLIGVAGLLPRISRVLQGWANIAGEGGVATQLRLLWLVGVVVLAAVLSVRIFKRQQTAKGWLWWVGLVMFFAFLPNAPYVLTDIIHLIRGTSSGQIPVWVIALVFIPIHTAAIVLGFEAYVISILNLVSYLKQYGAKALILPMELLIHALCALGIYLGRFLRFNSWDLVVDPTGVLADTLDILTSRRPVAVIFVTFVILASFYWLMKQITLGLKLRIRYARQGIDVLD
ncbi:DUF1361 domain-containing protein [Nodosilinea sp. PGN35]|uniref:DUF1361 domain-containing protein n=1 Tax=Nodosilinea sp. PGN35 TaxID=3020489 RepID=UPI0023B2251C|nr:DUF1361 domain-containing protein [Nodosilinea sp. TSF1-S3]MDF0367463.1 DUF1361 domain-containing protein [Nodosilinea sp. TSF1-S3]